MLFLVCDPLLSICCGLTPNQTMGQYPMPPLELATVTTWNFINRDRLSAWSLDPASSTAYYYGRVIITTHYGTLQIHQSEVWQTTPFRVPIHVILGASGNPPVDPQPETHMSSEDSTVPLGGLGATTQGGFEVGGPSAPAETLGETMPRPATAAGVGSLGEDSCYEIPPPLVTPPMVIDLVTSEDDEDPSEEVYEATSRARAPSESSCLVCGEHPCVCPR